MARSEMERDILRVLHSEEEIRQRVQTLGEQICEDFQGKNPLFVGVLKGCFLFMADVIRACQLRSEIEFIAVSSYGNGTRSSGNVQITRDLGHDITGRDLIVVEDILDSGNTLSYLIELLKVRRPSSIKICTLFDKPARRTRPIKADYVGFTVPDAFVVGYGLDYDQHYRNLPYIGILKPEIYGEN